MTQGILKSILQSLEAGLSHEEAAEKLRTTLGNKGCRKQERQYNCLTCLDQGRVEIWAPWCVAEFSRDGLHPDQARHRISVCACFCNRGKPHAGRLPRFDRLIHCQIVPFTGASGYRCHPQAVANLAMWIEDQKSVRAAKVEDPLFQGQE